MKTKTIKNAPKFQLTLSEDELLHIEAALDLFRSGYVDNVSAYLGIHDSRYDEGLVAEIHDEVLTLRESIPVC